ncbi:AAA family ATPase [uncultured Friedmanniella sp.]|uniref:AAA family ATPase n=1 Tax=uncultured Friedmanniella sp. TaxID=335381 RepID=UPI0035C96C0E
MGAVRGGRGWPHERRPVRWIGPSTSAPTGRSSWPASVPAVGQLLEDGLELPAGVTFLVGENGSGKSTLVEGVAGAFGLDVEGGTPNSRHVTRPSESELASWLQLTRGPGASRWGFFLRAESMHGYYTYLEGVANPRGTPRYHEMSHGESFLAVIERNVGSPGLYCLDEPEAALSFTSTLALIGLLAELARGDAQVLCATHSPVLCSLPGARILEVGEWGLRETGWDDLLLVEHWRSFLHAPQRYLRHVVDD